MVPPGHPDGVCDDVDDRARLRWAVEPPFLAGYRLPEYPPVPAAGRTFYLPKSTVPRGFFGRPEEWITVDIEFEPAPAGGGSPRPASGLAGIRDGFRAPITRRNGSDIVVGFSRPYASTAALDID